METVLLLIAASVLMASCSIFYGLTKFMHHEVKGSRYNNKAELLIFSGLWIFSKTHFNENLDSRFLVGRVCIVLIAISAFTLYKLSQ